MTTQRLPATRELPSVAEAKRTLSKVVNRTMVFRKMKKQKEVSSIYFPTSNTLVILKMHFKLQFMFSDKALGVDQ